MPEQNAGSLPPSVIGGEDLFVDRQSIKAISFHQVEKEDPALEPSEEVQVLLDTGNWVSSSNADTVQAFKQHLHMTCECGSPAE